MQLFFNGDRNFFIIIEDTKLLYSSYYDEFNNKKEEKWFMCKLHDGLNHGRVFQIGEGKVNSYTVYLDDFNLNLKERFVSHVFLDCIIAKNYAYCNYLLQEDIRLKNLQDFEKYFNDFDYFIELEEHSFALIKKNALVGIYKFEVKGNYISNIIHLS